MPFRFRSITDQSKSARELRQDPVTALTPFLVNPTANWEDGNLPDIEKEKKQEQEEMEDLRRPLKGAGVLTLFKNGDLPLILKELDPVDMRGYYNHPEYILMPRTGEPAKVNFRKDFTDSLKLFLLFYISQYMRSFINAINVYARAEFERKPTSRIRGLCWKPLTIKETYVFIGILIHMGSNKKSKITDYWNASRGPMDALLGVARYMSLRRF